MNRLWSFLEQCDRIEIDIESSNQLNWMSNSSQCAFLSVKKRKQSYIDVILINNDQSMIVKTNDFREMTFETINLKTYDAEKFKINFYILEINFINITLTFFKF